MEQDKLKEILLKASSEDRAAGMQMAIDLLLAAKDLVRIENQTWESAAAFIALTKADWLKESGQ